MAGARALSRLLRFTWGAYVEYHALASFKIRAIAIIGVLAYPFYYVVWTYVFPQPTDSLILRGIGMALCALLGLGPYWPRRLRRFYLLYAYLSLMYCLPVFFTTLLLMNDANTVWLMSTMAAFVFIVLLYDVRNSVIVGVIGSALGIGLFWALHGVQPLPAAYLASFPIFLFVLLAVAFLSYSERLISREKLIAAHALASNIAHEMRTPLAGIRMDAEAVRHELAPLVSNGEAPGQPGPSAITEARIRQLDHALDRVVEHTTAANLVIDMLLLNVTRDRISSSQFARYSAARTIEQALERFHFRPGERQLVAVGGVQDFEYFGSDLLLTHVLFNLLKNSMRAIQAARHGTITIMSEAQSGGGGRIVVTDTAGGIAPERVPLLFIPFVAGHPERHGTGIGLSFCKLVMDSFDGRIECRSQPGRGTQFVLWLPRPQPPSAERRTAPIAAAASEQTSS